MISKAFSQFPSHLPFLNEEGGEISKKLVRGQLIFGVIFSFLAIIVTDTAFAFQFRKSFFKGSGLRYFQHCSHYTGCFTFFLKFSFSLVCEYLNQCSKKYVPPDFWRKYLKLFYLNTYCLFFIQCVSSHIFCKQ